VVIPFAIKNFLNGGRFWRRPALRAGRRPCTGPPPAEGGRRPHKIPPTRIQKLSAPKGYKRDILGSYRLKRKSVPRNGKASRLAPRLSPGGFLCYLLHPEVASYSQQKPPISSPTFSPWLPTLLAASRGNLQFAAEAPQSAPPFPPGGPPKRAVLILLLCLHPLHLPESVDKAHT
jgi:hypothetical protein